MTDIDLEKLREAIEHYAWTSKDAPTSKLSDLHRGAEAYLSQASKSSTSSAVDGGWRSMDTAPKDGSTILIAMQINPLGRPNSYRLVIGYWNGDWADFGGKLWFTPTHWQPLAAPPLPQSAVEEK